MCMCGMSIVGLLCNTMLAMRIHYTTVIYWNTILEMRVQWARGIQASLNKSRSIKRIMTHVLRFWIDKADSISVNHDEKMLRELLVRSLLKCEKKEIESMTKSCKLSSGCRFGSNWLSVSTRFSTMEYKRWLLPNPKLQIRDQGCAIIFKGKSRISKWAISLISSDCRPKKYLYFVIHVNLWHYSGFIAQTHSLAGCSL